MRKSKELLMDNVLQTLGLAYRAKKIIFGEEVLENINDVKLLIIASDSSYKTKERYLKKCSYYKIDYIDKFNSGEISNALGKDNIKIVGVIDEGFKKSLLNN